jgi:cytidine deaminase
MTDQELVAEAIQARQRAYAVYSRFPVGAALLTRGGKVYWGCNVENAAYPLTTCAERVAVVKAVSAGDAELEAIAVVSETGAAPCGACRQVLREFAGPDGQLRVLIGRPDGSFHAHTLAELLPEAFTPNQLG